MLRLCVETGEWDFRKVMRELDARDLTGVWLPFFRLQQQALERDQQDVDATRARRAAERRVE